jgi:hypothetical protein
MEVELRDKNQPAGKKRGAKNKAKQQMDLNVAAIASSVDVPMEKVEERM